MALRTLSGVQSSGRLHLGNYYGAIREFVRMQHEGDALYFIANYHALTSVKDPLQARQLTFETALAYLALGLDPNKATLFRQSDIPEVTELYWILGSVVPMSNLERAHSYRDKIENRGITNPEFGLFAYPVLMAADILLYDSDVVPVGRDQKQHLEFTRDVAERFNHQMGETFVLPEARIDEQVMIVPGTDGEKMSKSRNNLVRIFAPEKELKQEVMGIVTDSAPLEAPKDPETNNVYRLFKLVAPAEAAADMAAKFRAGGYGYGHAKKELLAALLDGFRSERTDYDRLMNDKAELERQLHIGAEKARNVAGVTLKRVRERAGYGPKA